MPDEALEALNEYLYSQARPGLSHEQYLDEPAGVVAWQVAIHGLVQELKGGEIPE